MEHTGSSTEPDSTSPEALQVNAELSGRIGFRARADLSLSQAAFEAGRVVNRLAFHLQQAWFLSDEHEHQAQEVAGDLGRVARLLVPINSRDEIQRDAVSLVQRLLEGLDAEPRIEQLVDAQRTLRVDESADPVAERKWLLRPVFEAIDEVRRLLHSPLDDRDRLISHLGEVVDQAIHCADVYAYLYEPVAPINPVVRGEPKRISRETIWVQAGVEPNYLANVFRQPGELPPASDWSVDVGQLLIEVGIEQKVPAEILNAAPRARGADLIHSVDELGQLILAILGRPDPHAAGMEADAKGSETDRTDPRQPHAHAAVAHSSAIDTKVRIAGHAGPPADEERVDNALLLVNERGAGISEAIPLEPANSQVAATPSPQHYLGIRLNEKEQLVTREGYGLDVELTRRLLWGLLEHFVAREESLSTQEELGRVWGKVALTDTPTYNTVVDAISDLRKPLSELGLAIRVRRGLGWRLVDAKSKWIS